MKILPILVLITASSALSQGLDSLYAPAPPPNSAFVRVINASPTVLDAVLNGKVVTAPKAGISAYIVAPQGSVIAKSENVSTNLTVNAGKFYSAIWNGKTFKLLPDLSADDRAKALLTIYNLTSAPVLDLKTADGKLSVVSGVKSGESGSRTVNGITVSLSAFNGGKSLVTFKNVALERGSAYAIVVTNNGSSLTISSTAK